MINYFFWLQLIPIILIILIFLKFIIFGDFIEKSILGVRV